MRSGGRGGRWIWAAAAVVVVASAGVLPRATVAAADDAADPTTRPARQSPVLDEGPGQRRPGRMGGGNFGGGERFGAGGGGGMRLLPRIGETPNDAQRSDAMAFMSLHAPEYSKFIKGIADGEVRTNIENTLVGAYVSYQQLEIKEPSLYGVILKRIEVEDRLFSLRSKVRNGDDAARAALEPAIRKAAVEWCDLSLQERRLRLERLERTVKQEQSSLAADEGQRDRLIEDRVAQVMRGRGGGWPGGPAGRGDGGGGRGVSPDGSVDSDAGGRSR